MRVEVLRRLHHPELQTPLVVTYPEALPEKVVHQEVLAKNTWTLPSVVAARLLEQGFERTDFVYEAGQFAIRGGIIDIFSYAYQLPFRLALWGQEIESIRTFDPTSQRSLEAVSQATVLPNLHAPTTPLAHQSLLDCLCPATLVWIKDQELVLAAIEKSHAQATKNFQEKAADALPLPALRWKPQSAGPSPCKG